MTVLKASKPFVEDRYDFDAALAGSGVSLEPLSVETLQVNLGRLCNQACSHCHVDASPERTAEQMAPSTLDRCLEVLAGNECLKKLDITGGAPELNPGFERLVRGARALGRHVIVRHNLTVTVDPDPPGGRKMDWLPAFFASQDVEVVSSLPHYQEYFTDHQRGAGVFARSLESMRLLNAEGYGIEGSGLDLDLVYNPAGAFLPAPQCALQADYKRELLERYGLRFNRLFTITNMPINRFRRALERSGGYAAYMQRLVEAFNAQAAAAVMCRSLISVGWDGRIYDCDFNQMLELQVHNGVPMTLLDFDPDKLLARRIRTGSHCFGCTAGQGSSCGGQTA